MQRFVKQIRENALEYGSIPFWSWNDDLQPEELRRQIDVMHSLGMKGFFMHARGGLETEYLSDRWFECVQASVDEAAKLGMEAWSYDENGWPSGFAGGILLKDKANWATYLKYETRASFPEEENVLGVYILEDGCCRRVTAPEPGAAEYAVVLQAWDESYVDTMDGEITRKFIQHTHEEYKKRVGFSASMPGFFTDEPQYYRWATPWSNTMPREFSARYGYDVRDGLAALFADYDGAEEFRWDYYRLCHELFINNFVKVIYDWCEANGCKLTGHAVEESTLAGQMWCCGGVMPFYAYEHIPGIDYLGRNIASDIAPRQLGSACAQLGKKQAISEMFGCCGWDVSPTELKRIAELQYVNGVNMMCQHLYPYSIRGQRKNDYPCHYSEHLPWQKAMADFDRYFNHLGYVLSRGEERARVLVIHPIHSAYLTYKRKEDAASVRTLQEDLFALNRLLSEHQIAYHFGDECMMAEMADLEGAQMRVGRCVYDYVVVPAMDSLDESTAKLLREYLAAGGKLFLYGKAPTRVNGRKADLGWLQGNCSFEDIQAAADTVVTLEGKNAPQLRQMVRQTEDGRIFFITNLTDQHLKGVTVAVRGCKGLCSLDMNSLVYHMLPGKQLEDGSFAVTLDFEDAQSYVLIEAEGQVKPCAATARFIPRKPIPLDGGFTLVKKPENMMTLDQAELSYDGETYQHPRPIILIKDMLLRARYKGPLFLRYSFTIQELPESLRLAAEPLPYRSVRVNGNPISLDGDWWLDRSFRTADLAPWMRLGRNEVVFELDYFQRDYVYYVLYGGVSESLRNCLNFDTEIESVYLLGHFSVRTDPARMTPAENNALCYDGDFALAAQRYQIDLRNVVEDGYPFFGGEIEAETHYEYHPGGPAELVLMGRYAVCDVAVNGKEAGRLMFERHMDLRRLLKEGDNTITLRLYNSNRNLLGPHHFIVPEPLSVGPTTFTLESGWQDEQCPRYAPRYAFVRFGIDC